MANWGRTVSRMIVLRIRRGKVSLVVLLVGLFGVAVIAHSPERWDPDNALALKRYAAYEGVRVVRDDYDRRNYWESGSYVLREGARPYVDAYSEYPQVATYFFAVPHLFVNSRDAYAIVFSLLMVLVLYGTAHVVESLCRTLGHDPRRALYLLLPGTLYFTLNRFDTLVAFLSLLAVFLLIRGATLAAFSVLALATLTKIYPALYLPIFCIWTLTHKGLRGSAMGVLAFAAVLVACSLQLVWWTSLEDLLSPILTQGSRSDNSESLFHFVRLLWPGVAGPTGRQLFWALQVVPAIAGSLLLVRCREPIVLVRWLALTTLCVVMFARFQSPQWLIWFGPLAILACRSRGELWLLALVDVLTYVYFPLAYDFGGEGSALLSVTVGINLAMRLGLILSLMTRRGLEPRSCARGRDPVMLERGE